MISVFSPGPSLTSLLAELLGQSILKNDLSSIRSRGSKTETERRRLTALLSTYVGHRDRALYSSHFNGIEQCNQNLRFAEVCRTVGKVTSNWQSLKLKSLKIPPNYLPNPIPPRHADPARLWVPRHLLVHLSP